MRVIFLAITAALIGFAVRGWLGVWLLSTPDYQGARHFVGGLTVAVGAAVGLLGIGLAISTRRSGV